MNQYRQIGWGCATLAVVVNQLWAPPVQAHDFWIEPSSYRPALGETTQFALRIGEHFKGDSVPRNPAKLEQFILKGPVGVMPIAGQDGADPAGMARIEQPGIYVVGYRSKRSSIELEASKFEEYLKVEGLSTISKLRAERGESTKPGREVYSRAAKTLLNVGGSATAGFDAVLGLTFELVPLNNPFTLSVIDGELLVGVLYDGKPFDGAEVFAMSKDEPTETISATSDREGRARFRLNKVGVWMIKTIHMATAPPSLDADWESIWASLTIEIPPADETTDRP